MSLVVDVPPELEAALAEEAARLQLSLPEHVLRLRTADRFPTPQPQNGAELVDYWQAEGLAGTRPDIPDAPAHARALRQQAQNRERS